jgi:exodeoxyribonuclease VIII
MLDLETLGTGNNAVIIAIGAVLFDKDGVSNNRFYRRVDPQSCVDAGMEMSVSTIMWWMKQDDAARAEFNKPSLHISEALQSFSHWVETATGYCKFEERKVWGNGATFDNVILSNAYEACMIEKPWPYWGDTCYRTLKNLFPQIPMERSGMFHHALDDARSQAEHCIRLMKAAGVRND